MTFEQRYTTVAFIWVIIDQLCVKVEEYFQQIETTKRVAGHKGLIVGVVEEFKDHQNLNIISTTI